MSIMFRNVNLCPKECRHRGVVLGLLYSGTFVILYYVILTSNTHSNHSTIKTTHLEPKMRNKMLPKTQVKNIISNKPTNLAKTEIKTQDINGNNGECIHIETLDPNEVPCNKSMFFIESSEKAFVKLSTRQSCSVESAARINPDRLVFVLFLGQILDCQTDITPMTSLITNYRNIRFRYVDIQKYADNTPVQDFVKSGVINNTIYPVEKRSDLLRLITLWKFGGIYMDLDSISLKPLPLIDSIGAEDSINLASGIIGIIHRKDIAEKALKLYIEKWNGNIWGNTGPLLFTELMRKICNTTNVKIMYSGKADCNNFTIYPPEVFYPIGYYRWRMFFNNSQRENVREIIKDSMSVHLWNHVSRDELIILKSGQPYEDIAKDYCPNVLSTVIDQF